MTPILHRLWPCASTFEKNSRKTIFKNFRQKSFDQFSTRAKNIRGSKNDCGVPTVQIVPHFLTLGAKNFSSGQKLNFCPIFETEE